MKMPKEWLKQTGLVLALCLGAALIGALAGSWAGSMTAKQWLEEQKTVQGLHLTNGTSTQSGKTSPIVATSTQIRLVELASGQNAMRTVPDSVLTRKSPTATLYVQRHTLPQDNVLRVSEETARAVAVTADGWFVTAALALEGIRAADVTLWYDHQAYKIDKAVADKATGALFLKTSAHDLPAPAFVSASGKRAGLAVWIESDPEEFTQSTVSAYRLADYGAGISSDKVERRLVVQTELKAAERGAPLWDTNGSLVGVVERLDSGQAWALSASAVSASLQGLVSDGEIKHASLGVNSFNLASMRLAAIEPGLPNRGAWLKDDKKVAAVTRGGAGEKAGLKSGDVILQIDRDILDSDLDLSDVVMQYKPGVTVTFRVWRQDKEIELPVTFGTQTTGQAVP